MSLFLEYVENHITKIVIRKLRRGAQEKEKVLFRVCRQFVKMYLTTETWIFKMSSVPFTNATFFIKKIKFENVKFLV